MTYPIELIASHSEQRSALLGVVVLGGVGAAGLWKYQEQPQFCGTCHIMEPYVES